MNPDHPRSPYRSGLRTLAIVAIAGWMNGCASIATETGYVFAADDAVDNPAVKDPFCAHIRNYKGEEPTYYAEYAPEADFAARLQLLAPRVNHNHSVGPGLFVPLPILPDPWGNSASVYYHDAPEKQFDKVIIAVYPNPFKKDYFFTPAHMRLDVAGQSLFPTRVVRHYSVNHSAQRQDLGIKREKLKAQSGEFESYVVEFDVTDIASAAVSLHVDGFDRNGTALAARDFPMSVNQSKVFDWKYDTDCNF